MFLRRDSFLELSWVVNFGLPDLDPALLIAVVHRWRPETHIFHLPCSEMTITLQDIALIFGLMDGPPVSGILDMEMYRDLVEQYYRIRPPEDAEAARAK